MKQIGTTSNGCVIVEMTEDDVKRYDQVNETLNHIRALLGPAPGTEKESARRTPLVMRSQNPTRKARKLAKAPGRARKSNREIAMDVLRAASRPMNTNEILEYMKAAGAVFKSKDPRAAVQVLMGSYNNFQNVGRNLFALKGAPKAAARPENDPLEVMRRKQAEIRAEEG